MSDDIQRTLGEHSATLRLLEETVSHIDGKLDQLVAAESERKGARKTVYAIAAAVGSAASLAVTAAIEAIKR